MDILGDRHKLPWSVREEILEVKALMEEAGYSLSSRGNSVADGLAKLDACLDEIRFFDSPSSLPRHIRGDFLLDRIRLPRVRMM